MNLTRAGLVLLCLAAPGITSCGDDCKGCRIDEQCYQDGTSEPKNPCRVCDVERSKNAWSSLDGEPCDDGLFCTIEDSCSQGSCFGEPRVCDDAVACNGVETCDEEANACVLGEDQCDEGLVCNPGSGECVLRCHHCSIDDVCYFNGEVHPTNPCQICDSSLDPFAWSDRDGVACDDGSFCNGTDTCQGGACAAHAGDPCPDDVLCNGTESCDETLDICLHSNDACPAGQSCEEDGTSYQCCAPRDHLECNADGDVAWIDSCGQELELATDCASSPAGACVDAACVCLEGFTDPPGCARCVIFVNQAGGDDANDGRGWALAKATLQAGLAAAVDDACEVWVAEGTYLTTETQDRDLSFEIAAGVDLYGGFAGNESSPEQRDLDSHQTILSGEIGDPDVETDNARQVVVAANNTIFDGFVVTGAYNDFVSGGGYYAANASLTIRNSRFVDNYSRSHGGGIFVEHSAGVRIERCSFINNRSFMGGGVALDEATAFVSDSRFDGNIADYLGGGLNLQGGTALFRSVDLIRNTGEHGGGFSLFGDNAEVICSNCVLEGNNARSGGGFYMSAGNGTAIFNNSVWVANAAEHGGGLAMENGAVALRNATLVGNVCASVFASSGGGLFTGSASVSIAGSILWNNLAVGADADEQQLRYIANRPWVRSSAVEGGSVFPGEGNINDDPLLRRLPPAWDGAMRASDASTLVVADATLYSPGDIIELRNDGVARTVETVAANEVTFSPALDEAHDRPLAVTLWGEEAADLSVDVTLATGSPAIDASRSNQLLADDADLDRDGDTDERTPVDLQGSPRVQGEDLDMGAYEQVAP